MATAPPQYRLPMVGRDAVRGAVVEALQGAGGLCTLVGPGGVGKTRLAAAVAQQWTGERWWVDLQAVRDEAGLVRATAHALLLGPDVDLAGAFATRGPALLVLDNFEQIAEDAAETVDGWVRAARLLRVLVTSRRPTGLSAEQVFDVEPLPTADATRVLLAAAPAVFDPDSAHAACLSEVLVALDGLPLALELAAARLDVMKLEQLRDRLADPLAVLTDPSHPRSRHGGLRRAIASSWDLLDEPERAAVAQCAVFRGGFTLEAAEAVVQVADLPTLDLLQRLRLHRLLTFDGGRFGMLESIRLFAVAQLDDSDAVAGRHGAWFTALARAQTARLGTAEVSDALEILGREYDNLCAVVESAEAGRVDPDQALAVGIAVGALLEHRGPASAQVPFVDRVLALAGPSPTQRARLLRQRGVYLHRLRRVDEAVASLDEAERLAGDDAGLLAQIQIMRADVHMFSGAPAAARRDYLSALDYARRAGDADQEAAVLIQLALVAHDAHDDDEARALEARALDLARSAGNPLREARVHGAIASMAMERLGFELAVAHGEAALEIYERLDIPRSVAFTRGQLGHAAEVQGQVDEARAHYLRAVEGARATRDLRNEGVWAGFLGRLHLGEGQVDRGREELEQALRLLQAVRAPRFARVFRIELAYEAAHRADVDAARRYVEGALDGNPDPQDEPFIRMPLVAAEALHAAEHGRAEVAADKLAEAEAQLAEVPWVSSSPRVVQMERLLERVREAQRAWVFAVDGSWFEAPDGTRVSVGPANGRILLQLARLHRQDPDVAQIEDLVQAAWPGERLVPSAAANRVYVALATLRKAGLRTILQGARPGWRLDPRAPIRIERPADEP